MNLKTKSIIIVVCLACAYAFGRYSAPEKIITETKIVEVDKKTDKTDSDTEKYKKTTTEVVVSPDGTKKETTTITEDTNRHTDKESIEDSSKSQEDKKVIIGASGHLNASVLVGADISSPYGLIYGLHMSRNFIGPITLGVFGMTNKTVGISLGLTF